MLVAIPRSFARVRQASDRARSDHFLGHAFGMFEERKSIEEGERARADETQQLGSV